MERLMAPLWPTLLSLLKLQGQPPALPEDSAFVRHVRPSAAWLISSYVSTALETLWVSALIGFWPVLLGALLYYEDEGFPLWLLGSLTLIVLALIFAALCTAYVDFYMRHYLVGNRSLRVVQHVWVRQEVTISYANVQNISVVQSPWERLFGCKSLHISTAGTQAPERAIKLVGLKNADELRGLILGMREQQKPSGLGEAAAHDGTASRLQEIRSAAMALRTAARLRHRR